MYTRIGQNLKSNIYQKLEKEDVTLFEILEEDDVIIESKQQNTKLISFFSKKEILSEIIKIITIPFQKDKFLKENNNNENEKNEDEILSYISKMSGRFPQIITDILLIDNCPLIDIISKDEELLDLFFYFFKEKNAKPNFEQNWIKILNRLFNSKPGNVQFFL